MDPKKEPVPPVQNVIVGDRVHYTDIEYEDGRPGPSRPRSAIVLAVNEFTGKPTLEITRYRTRQPVTPGKTHGPWLEAAILVTCVEEVEFSPAPAGARASMGCWSWPVRPSSEPPVGATSSSGWQR